MEQTHLGVDCGGLHVVIYFLPPLLHPHPLGLPHHFLIRSALAEAVLGELQVLL